MHFFFEWQVWFPYHFVLRPALLDQLGHRLLHQALQSFPCVVTALVKLRDKHNRVLFNPFQRETQNNMYWEIFAPSTAFHPTGQWCGSQRCQWLMCSQHCCVDYLHWARQRLLERKKNPSMPLNLVIKSLIKKGSLTIFLRKLRKNEMCVMKWKVFLYCSQDWTWILFFFFSQDLNQERRDNALQRPSLEINKVTKGNHHSDLSPWCHIQTLDRGTARALPPRINKLFSLELQMEGKVKRQWPASNVHFPVYRLGI